MDYKNYYILPAPPEEVFKALTFEPTIRLWTGADVTMPTEIGEEFSMWDGQICGRILGLEEGKQIVQEWFFGDLEEPSIVTIKLHPHKKGTSLELKHTNIPDEDYDDIVEGWNDIYFDALYDFYEED
ncbi:MAG: SRPBCC domain-containing protein [Chitinophagaceae bacterium]